MKDMSADEIAQFLTCARVGRLGVSLAESPYIVPVGYGYSDGRIFFHTCAKGLKMKAIAQNPDVCFEVDECLSDASMFKSVIAQGRAEIIADREQMVPYLQKLIDKYRVPLDFDRYMLKIGANSESELKAVRICVIMPKKISGRMFMPRDHEKAST
jgi:nitroimidazol reductase NimA-like FMN-containing flavoprotein (pyridoxamine 5'-phosphate oxidase superfamily)